MVINKPMCYNFEIYRNFAHVWSIQRISVANGSLDDKYLRDLWDCDIENNNSWGKIWNECTHCSIRYILDINEWMLVQPTLLEFS